MGLDLIFLYSFVVYFGIGAVLGLVVARVALSRAAQKIKAEIR